MKSQWPFQLASVQNGYLLGLSSGTLLKYDTDAVVQVTFLRAEILKISVFLALIISYQKFRGVAKGGIWGSEPNFFGHFYQNSNKTTFRNVSAALPHPQNPLL